VKRGVVFLAALLLTPPQAEAAPALSPLFTDRMVLQRDQQVPVWGTAATNEIITVTFTDQSKTVGVDTNGRWRVRLDPMPASREPRELRVTSSRGREEIVLRDVLVGDVWLAGGQSNMGSRMKEYLPTVAPEIPQANYPLFRVFTVPQRKVLSESMPSAAWRTVTPDTVPDVSATAYFFGRDLQRHLRVPIGIVVCAWGGTLAENWIDRELLLGHPETKPIVERYDAAVAAYGGDANYQSRLADWQRILAEWKEKRRAEGKAGPRTKEPMGPEHFQRPSGLYETMFKTMPPFAFKGVIFYQGESNVADGRSYQYRHLLPMLVSNWRRDLGHELPFLVVQLPVIKGLQEDEWAEMRESQAVACRETKGCELAVVLEYGEFDKLHPTMKEGVGTRLARLARGVVYGEDIVCRGPTLRSHRVEDDHLILEFDSVGGGLVAQGELADFFVSDASGKFVPAQAKIVGQSVVVRADGIEKPVAVRYGWKNFFKPSLFNREGLPAGPFRTDSFPLKTEGNR
jgi:sialate O-acetylesterase